MYPHFTSRAPLLPPSPISEAQLKGLAELGLYPDTRGSAFGLGTIFISPANATLHTTKVEIGPTGMRAECDTLHNITFWEMILKVGYNLPSFCHKTEDYHTVTALWFRRTKDGWYWTPYDPIECATPETNALKREFTDCLHEIPWMPSSTTTVTASPWVVFNTWVGQTPAEKNVAIIQALNNDTVTHKLYLPLQSY